MIIIHKIDHILGAKIIANPMKPILWVINMYSNWGEFSWLACPFCMPFFSLESNIDTTNQPPKVHYIFVLIAQKGLQYETTLTTQDKSQVHPKIDPRSIQGYNTRTHTQSKIEPGVHLRLHYKNIHTTQDRPWSPCRATIQDHYHNCRYTLGSILGDNTRTHTQPKIDRGVHPSLQYKTRLPTQDRPCGHSRATIQWHRDNPR